MKELTCIICPLGCALSVDETDGGKIRVEGNTCLHGAEYAESEICKPVRTLTTSIITESGEMVSVKSEKPLPKRILLDAIREISSAKVKAPVNVGDVVVKNILDSGINIVATRSTNVL